MARVRSESDMVNLKMEKKLGFPPPGVAPVFKEGDLPLVVALSPSEPPKI